MAIEQIATLEAIDRVLDAMGEARQSLRRAETTYRRFRGRIEKGATVEEAFAGLGVAEQRRDLTDTLDRCEHARHESRLTIIKQGVSEGLSLGALARLWGVSRQLITRLAHESSANGELRSASRGRSGISA
jgi:DNA-directed RNA polymerase subunit N (RpoN/RPB10)